MLGKPSPDVTARTWLALEQQKLFRAQLLLLRAQLLLLLAQRSDLLFVALIARLLDLRLYRLQLRAHRFDLSRHFVHQGLVAHDEGCQEKRQRMRTLGLGICAQQRTSPRRLWSAARPFSAARALRAHHECGQRARAGVLRPGSLAEHTGARLRSTASARSADRTRRPAHVPGARRGAAVCARACAAPPPPRGPPSRRAPPRCRCAREQRARTGAERGARARHACGGGQPSGLLRAPLE
jgi:hypothetical protein